MKGEFNIEKVLIVILGTIEGEKILEIGQSILYVYINVGIMGGTI